VQLCHGKRTSGAWIEEDEVGVRARSNLALAGPESEDFRGVRTQKRDQVPQRHVALHDPEGMKEEQRRLDAGEGVGRTKREVIFTVLADSLDEARQKFRASGRPDSDALFIIKTETEIYLA